MENGIEDSSYIQFVLLLKDLLTKIRLTGNLLLVIGQYEHTHAHKHTHTLERVPLITTSLLVRLPG